MKTMNVTDKILMILITAMTVFMTNPATMDVEDVVPRKKELAG